MASLIISLTTLAGLAFVLFKHKSEKAIVFSAQTRWLFWAGIIVLGLYSVFWFALGFAEFNTSISVSLFHIIPGAAALIMLWIARKIPLETGLALGFQGLALAIYTLAAVSGTFNNRLASALFTAAPPILAGLLILWACGLSLTRPKQS
jgi:hypothetical protein